MTAEKEITTWEVDEVEEIKEKDEDDEEQMFDPEEQTNTNKI